MALPNRLDSSSEDEEPTKVSEKEIDEEEVGPTRLDSSESESEEPKKSATKDSDDEDSSDSDDEGPKKTTTTKESDEEKEDPKKDSSSDSDDETPKKTSKKISGDEDSEDESPAKTSNKVSGDEDSDDESPAKTSKKISEDEDSDVEPPAKTSKKMSGDEDSDDESSSDSEDDELVKASGKEIDDEEAEPQRLESSESESEEPNRSNKVYDFDIMMAKKKEENSRKRRRRGYDIINDNDDIIADIINQMKDAAEGDAEANRSKQAAIRKLKLLPFVMSQLRKIEMRDAFLDSDVLSVMTEWLAPLPDKSLPHLQVRESILKTLIDMNLYDVDRIKNSGIGKAVMYLFKHPRETKENKVRAKQLISSWSRPIFQLDSSFTSISREEREQRDLELMNKQRRASRTSDSSPGDGSGPSQSKPKKFKDDNTNAQKPGDKGWIPRARVPAPSMRDYVIRPRSKVDGDIGKSSKRPSNMLEKYMKSQQERKRAGRQQRAVNMNIDRG